MMLVESATPSVYFEHETGIVVPLVQRQMVQKVMEQVVAAALQPEHHQKLRIYLLETHCHIDCSLVTLKSHPISNIPSQVTLIYFIIFMVAGVVTSLSIPDYGA